MTWVQTCCTNICKICEQCEAIKLSRTTWALDLFIQPSLQGQYPSVEDMTVAERALHEMRTQIRLMQEEAAKAQEEAKKKELAESQRKLVELKTQQEAQKKAEQLAKERAQKQGGKLNS